MVVALVGAGIASLPRGPWSWCSGPACRSCLGRILVPGDHGLVPVPLGVSTGTSHGRRSRRPGVASLPPRALPPASGRTSSLMIMGSCRRSACRPARAHGRGAPGPPAGPRLDRPAPVRRTRRRTSRHRPAGAVHSPPRDPQVDRACGPRQPDVVTLLAPPRTAWPATRSPTVSAVPPPRLPAPPRPLVVTDDPDVLEELLRIAATAGTELDVAPDAGAARRCWASAGLVVVAADAAEGCARLRLPRRGGVVLLGADLDDAGVWQLAVEVGAERVLFLPDGEPWLGTAFADAVEGSGPEGLVVAVLGGRGGSGGDHAGVGAGGHRCPGGPQRAARRRRPARRRDRPRLRRRGRPRPAVAGPRRHPRPGAGRCARGGAAPHGRPLGAVVGPGRRRPRAGRGDGRRAGGGSPGARPGRRRPAAGSTRRPAWCSRRRLRPAGRPRRGAGRGRRRAGGRLGRAALPRPAAWSCAARRRAGSTAARWPRALGLPLAGRAAPRARPRRSRSSGASRRPAAVGDRSPSCADGCSTTCCPRSDGRRDRARAAAGAGAARPGAPPARGATGSGRAAAAVAAALRAEGGALRGDARRARRSCRRCSSEIVGAGPLEPLLRDPRVTDVLVNGPGEVWVDRGDGLERTGVRFADDAAVRRLAQRLAAPDRPAARRRAALGRRPPRRTASGCTPCCRRWRRAAPACRCGCRAGGRSRWRSSSQAGAVPPDGARAARRLVAAARSRSSSAAARAPARRRCSRRCSSLVDPGDRLLLVEDAGELAPDHPHVVRLEARPANVEGAGEVDAARPRPAGAAHATRPAGRRRGPRRRGRRPAGGAQHRPRGRVRHAARQLRARRPGTAGGARRVSRARAGRRCTASSRPGCAWWCTWRGTTAAVPVGWRRSASCSAGPDGLVQAVPAWIWDGAAPAGAAGPGASGLAALLDPSAWSSAPAPSEPAPPSATARRRSTWSGAPRPVTPSAADSPP